MAKPRELLKLDVSSKLKKKLRDVADVMEAKSGGRVSTALVARIVLTAGPEDRAFCRRAGIPFVP